MPTIFPVIVFFLNVQVKCMVYFMESSPELLAAEYWSNVLNALLSLTVVLYFMFEVVKRRSIKVLFGLEP